MGLRDSINNAVNSISNAFGGGGGYNYSSNNYSGDRTGNMRPAPRPTQNNNTSGGRTSTALGANRAGQSNTKDGPVTTFRPANQGGSYVKEPTKAATPTKPAKTPEQIAAEKAATDKAAKDKLTKEQGAARTAYTGDLTHDISDAFAAKNVNTGDYQTQIDHAIADALKGIKPTTDYSSFAKPDFGETLLGDIRTKQITDYQGDLNKTYGSGTYADELFPTTRDDAILESILAPQRTEANAALTRAFDRGTLGQVGYDAGLADLVGQGTAGMSRLQATGGGVMDKYKTDINDAIGNAQSSAGAWDFGSTWTPDSARTTIGNMGTDFGNRLEGDIRGAVGGEQFFDWNDLIRKGGMAQGLYNPATDETGGGGTNLAAAIADRSKRENTKRGLGTQGTF